MFDGNGNWTSDFSAQADRDNGIKILASRFDNIFIADIKESFENCLTKDGQITPIGNFNMGGHRITNLDDGVNSSDAVNKGQIDEAISEFEQKIFPVGSIYSTVGNTNPNSILGFGTWTLLTSSVVTSVQSYVAVIGNGKGLGLTDGTTEGYLSSWRPGSAVSGTLALSNSNTLGNNQGNYATGSTSAFGISSDPTKSGLIADTSSLATLKTIYIWQRTA